MLFLLSKELWRKVRHCARKQTAAQPELWHWTACDFGGDVRLRSIEEDRTLSSLIDEAARARRGPVSIVAASPTLSRGFSNVISFLLRHSDDLRISLMLTSPMKAAEVERCRSFLDEHPDLRSRVSTFFVAVEKDTDFAELESAEVSRQYAAFLRLLIQGGESLADSLGIFRETPKDDLPNGDSDDLDEFPIDRFSAPLSQGVLAALGVRTWIPQRERIISLTESLMTKLVAEEEKRAAIGARVRSAEPAMVVGQALYLGGSDEPLGPQDFAEQIPEPPPSPLESWKVPVSRGRARKERRHLQRTVQKDFADYTEALKMSLDQITEIICYRSQESFSQAVDIYRNQLLEEIDMGSLSILARKYYPAFQVAPDETLAGPPEPSKGWLPHESLDCFCQVYDALEEGLEKLPTAKTWAAMGFGGLLFLGGAMMLLGAGTALSAGLAIAGLLTPGALWVYRTIYLNRLRKRLVETSNRTFHSLRVAFEEEVQWVVHQTQVQLERDLRKDAGMFCARLQEEFDSMPWLKAAADVDPDGIQEDIRQLRAALLATGVDENRLDKLIGRLPELARNIIESARRERLPEEEETTPELRPHELVEEWFDELVGTAVLPLEKVKSLKDDILETAGAWRTPALMAPLTDAELHRGFKKLVVLPDTDIVYQQLKEDLPQLSGNAVVKLDVWTGEVPGIAICSVMSGLSESILGPPVKIRGNGTRHEEMKTGNGSSGRS